MSGYQIADEPRPSTLTRFAVNPLFPFLAAMLGGVWIAWPWFAFNSFAIGSPTRKTEIVWLIGGLVVAVGATFAIIFGLNTGALPDAAAPYAGLAISLAKLAVLYAVFLLQSRTVEIYQYYGGTLANGLWPLLIAFYFRGPLLESMPTLVRLVLG